MSSKELKLYFITYYRPLVYFEVFSIYLSVFHEFMWSPKKAKKNFFAFFWIYEFFFSLFLRGGAIIEGGQLLGQFGYSVVFNSCDLKVAASSKKILCILRHIVFVREIDKILERIKTHWYTRGWISVPQTTFYLVFEILDIFCFLLGGKALPLSS